MGAEVEHPDGVIHTMDGVIKEVIYSLKSSGAYLATPIADCTALLYDLSDITDEDGLEACTLGKGYTGLELIKVHRQNTGIVFEVRFVHDNPQLNLEDGYHYTSFGLWFNSLTWQQVDYLRLHHYATSEEYFKNGWAKRRVRG